MNQNTFFALFEKQRPSVKSFYELLNGSSPETQEMYYRYACFLFMNEYNNTQVWNQIFLTNLAKNNLPRFNNYLRGSSGLHTLACEVLNPKTIPQVFHMLAANGENVKSSYEQISFCAQLSFKTNLTIRTLEENIRRCRFTPETFFELAEYVKIYW